MYSKPRVFLVVQPVCDKVKFGESKADFEMLSDMDTYYTDSTWDSLAETVMLHCFRAYDANSFSTNALGNAAP